MEPGRPVSYAVLDTDSEEVFIGKFPTVKVVS
jgi:hypothetical protein